METIAPDSDIAFVEDVDQAYEQAVEEYHFRERVLLLGQDTDDGCRIWAFDPATGAFDDPIDYVADDLTEDEAAYLAAAVDQTPDLVLLDGEPQLTESFLAEITPLAEAALSHAGRATRIVMNEDVVVLVKGRRFLVPSQEIDQLAEELEGLNQNEQLRVFGERYEQAPEDPVTGLYTWASASEGNVQSLRLISLFGLRTRLAASKTVGEISLHTSRPLAYIRADQVMNKTELKRAHEAAIKAQTDAGNNSVVQIMNEVFSKKNPMKRSFIVGFQDTFDANGFYTPEGSEIGSVVGCFTYTEPNPKRRGPEVLETPIEVFERAFHRDGGQLVSFDLSGSVLRTAGRSVATMLAYAQTQSPDDAFDHDLEPKVDLTQDGPVQDGPAQDEIALGGDVLDTSPTPNP